MDSEVVTITVKKGTANWLQWGSAGDKARGKSRAAAAYRLIKFWERVKRFKRWTPCVKIAPTIGSQRRWVRRNLYTLQNAGLVETRIVPTARGGRTLEFRKAR